MYLPPQGGHSINIQFSSVTQWCPTLWDPMDLTLLHSCCSSPTPPWLEGNNLIWLVDLKETVLLYWTQPLPFLFGNQPAHRGQGPLSLFASMRRASSSTSSKMGTEFASVSGVVFGSPAACRHKPHLTGSSLLEIKVCFCLLSYSFIWNGSESRLGKQAIIYFVSSYPQLRAI